MAPRASRAEKSLGDRFQMRIGPPLIEQASGESLAHLAHAENRYVRSFLTLFHGRSFLGRVDEAPRVNDTSMLANGC